MHKFFRYFFLTAIFLTVIGCEGLKNSAKNIFESSERAKYERRFSGADSLLAGWKKSYSEAVNSRLEVKDGFVATLNYKAEDLDAVGYMIDLKKGDLLIAEAGNGAAGSQIFVDFFELQGTQQSSESKKLENGTYSKFIEKAATYRIVIQPEIGFSGKFNLRIYTQPSISFPVAGKGNRDIQSFWGANRDGGARSHEGVDIFAARGTPVVAAVNGMVTRTGNSGLGGKQVWLRDGILGNSLYYAHLDRIMTEGGRNVKIGDTLGTVGNTGNAEGGAPHLHFGIYTMGGATDPYPYIRKREIPAFKTADDYDSVNIKSGSNMRSGPGLDFETVGTVEEGVSAKVLAASGDWLHVKTEANLEGFLSKSRISIQD